MIGDRDGKTSYATALAIQRDHTTGGAVATQFNFEWFRLLLRYSDTSSVYKCPLTAIQINFLSRRGEIGVTE